MKAKPGERQMLLWDNMRPYRPPERMARLRPWNTVEQVAEYFQVSDRTVRNWIDEGALNAVLKGQCLRVAKQSIRLFVHQNRVGKDDYDAFAARRAAIAEINAVTRQHLAEVVADPRTRKRLASKIWAGIAPVIRGHRGEL